MDEPPAPISGSLGLERRRNHASDVRLCRFECLVKHFGINQLTSYRSIQYEELKSQLNDRQVQSQAWRELTRLKSASRHYETYRQQRQTKLDELHEKLKDNQLKKETAQEEVSRVDQLIEQDMVRMDTGAKRLMDALKITARNLFYQALAPFKQAYNNYRDDHDYFRQLTMAAGVLRWTGQVIEVHLVPHLNDSPQLRNIIQKLMISLNDRKLTLPDGSQRPLRFRLTDKQEVATRLQLRSDPL